MTRRLNWLMIAVSGLCAALVETVRADEGMWLINRPPVKLLKEKYKFEPDMKWLEHVQKSCVRFSTGGSGSIISADGLVMTNHHVGSDMLEHFSTPEKNLMQTGFYARTREEELKCPDLELMALWSIEDVTQRVKGAATPGMSSTEAHTARRKMMTTIEDEAEKRTGLDCEVVTLWQGGQYHLYCYKRFTDVRLVMAPEEEIAFFGGDNDNFEYPRFDLDVCFFRIYVDDQPLKPQHFLKWSPAGANENDLALVCGHPGRTQRLNTVEHLEFLRDVDFPFALRSLWQREVELFTFTNRGDEHSRIGRNDYFGVQNSRKAQSGIMAGLLDPALFQTKIQAEVKLRQAVESKSESRELWGGAWEVIASAQRNLHSFYPRYQVLERRGNLRSDLYGHARDLVRLAEEKTKPNTDRLREFRESELDSLELELFSPAPIYDNLEVHRLTSGLTWMAMTLGADDPAVIKVLGGQSPQDRAAALIKGTKLNDVAERRKLAEGGKEAIAASKDSLIQLALMMDPEARAVRKRFEDEIESAERDGYDKIASAKFAIEGANSYPDATFTLRLAFGPIKGYEENNRKVAPFTTIGGAYQRMQERHGEEPFRLPKSWLDRKDKLDLNTPFNFICTTDIIGGNSGSPVINTRGEVIGLIFDGNLQSLIWDIQYTDEQGRAIAVDSRAIIEALRKVYDAAALVEEIMRR